MEKSLKGTKTEKNLLKAFAGESQAKNRYDSRIARPVCIPKVILNYYQIIINNG